MSEKLRVADIFGGIGGFRKGMEQASDDFEFVWYCDINKYSVEIYNKRFGENYEATDITTIKADNIPDIDILCGGFPCQAFSIAGNRKGFDDTRGTMFFEIARILKAKRPTYLFLENVKGLLNHNNGETFTIILQTLDELGYGVEWMVLNSKFFGVPQNRERIFIIGHLRGTSRPQILPFRQRTTEVSGIHAKKEYVKNVDNKETSYTIDANYYKGGGVDSFFKKKRRQLVW